MLRFNTGDHVITEFGAGVVTHSSGRRVVVDLGAQGSINVAVGTFGFDRIVKIGA